MSLWSLSASHYVSIPSQYCSCLDHLVLSNCGYQTFLWHEMYHAFLCRIALSNTQGYFSTPVSFFTQSHLSISPNFHSLPHPILFSSFCPCNSIHFFQFSHTINSPFLLPFPPVLNPSSYLPLIVCMSLPSSPCISCCFLYTFASFLFPSTPACFYFSCLRLFFSFLPLFCLLLSCPSPFPSPFHSLLSSLSHSLLALLNLPHLLYLLPFFLSPLFSHPPSSHVFSFSLFPPLCWHTPTSHVCTLPPLHPFLSPPPYSSPPLFFSLLT